MDKSLSIFIAACVGALVPIMFGARKPPGSNGRSALGKLGISVAYVLLAGYLALFVFRVPNEYEAFLMGLALDSLIRLVPRTASAFAKNLLANGPQPRQRR